MKKIFMAFAACLMTAAMYSCNNDTIDNEVYVNKTENEVTIVPNNANMHIVDNGEYAEYVADTYTEVYSTWATITDYKLIEMASYMLKDCVWENVYYVHLDLGNGNGEQEYELHIAKEYKFKDDYMGTLTTYTWYVDANGEAWDYTHFDNTFCLFKGRIYLAGETDLSSYCGVEWSEATTWMFKSVNDNDEHHYMVEYYEDGPAPSEGLEPQYVYECKNKQAVLGWLSRLDNQYKDK